MPRNHETHDRAHPPLTEGRAPEHVKKEGKKGGVHPPKSGRSEGGIPHSEKAQGHGHSELRSDFGGKEKAQHYEREGEHFTQPEGPAGASNMTKSHHDGLTAKAEHHPAVGSEPHRFDKPMSKGAHGFGHDATQRRGVLRTSGHSGAHMIGKR